MVDYNMKQGKDGVYSVDTIVPQTARTTKSGLLSKIGKSVKSGVAGALALGAAYGVSIPQKANADIIYDLNSHTNALQPFPEYNSEFRDVIYQSPQVNFRDMNGNLIGGGLTNKVVLLYVANHDSPINGLFMVGGLTIQPGENTSANGWFWSRDSPELFGMQGNETATNGLNGSSYWAGGIDLNGNGTIGTYTLNDNGTWNLEFESNEGMFHSGDPNLLPGQYSFALNGVPQHPASGTEPVSIDSIDIYTPYTVPEPSTTVMIGLGAAAAAAYRRRKSSSK